MKPTQAQTQAIRSQAPRICVDAGAGSGKTRVLVERMVHLIESGQAALDEIVAITFTDKAAAEMRARLRAAFRAMAPQDDSERMSFWRDQERNLENARISTIHSFCIGLLREHALHLGLNPEFSILGEAEDSLLKTQCVRAVLTERLDARDPAILRLAAEYRLPALEENLLAFVARRTQLGALLDNEAYLEAATLEAHWNARNEEERIRRLNGLPSHPAIPRFLRRLRELEGSCSAEDDAWENWRRMAVDLLETARNGLPTEDAAALLVRIQQKEGRGKKTNWSSEADFKQVGDIKKALDRIAQDILGGEEKDPALESRCAALTVDFLSVYRHVEAGLQEAMARDAVLDFEEAIQRTCRALALDQALRARVAAGMRYLLIDEFQDTDSTQLEIARLLHECEGGPALFVVGDPKQSIYYFRGAEVEVFNDARQDSAELIRLDRNFRTLPEVMGFVNLFFCRSNALAAVDTFQAMGLERKGDGLVRVGIQMLREPGGGPKRKVGEIRRAEAEQIARRILDFCDGAITLTNDGGGSARTPNFGDIAILFRATSNVGLYQEALRRAGIPYLMASGAGFYRQQEVTDLLNVLHVLADPWDDAALLAFLRSPMAGLADDTITCMAQHDRLSGVFAAPQLPDGLPEPDRVAHAQALIARLAEQAHLPVPDLLRAVLRESEYEAVLLGQHLGVQRFSNLRKLVGVAERYNRQPGASLRGFIHYIESVKDGAVREAEAPLLPEGAGAVSLMTIHKSKGLEFPIVIIPDMAEGQGSGRGETIACHRKVGCALPVTNDSGDRHHPALHHAIMQRRKMEEQEEYSRLLYVALTRARDYLLLCGHDKPKPDSWFDLLEGVFGLCSKDDGALIGASGCRAALLSPLAAGSAMRSNSQAVDSRVLQAHLDRAAQPLVRPAPAVDSISVSYLLDALVTEFDPESEGPQEATLRQGPRGALSPLQRGTLVHRMMELWQFTEEYTPAFGMLMREAGIGLSDWDAVLEDLESIAARFRGNKFYGTLAHGQPMAREIPFQLRAGKIWLSGTMDAVLADGTIVDYKTGKYGAAQQERYKLQILLYALAHQRLRGMLPPRGLIYYVDAGRIETVLIAAAEVAEIAARAEDLITVLQAKARGAA
ncbi:MAG: UvrD-helicase domain-containing protein [Candidatus Hydrogenedentes bacterium]|nr:UvrD-helicase domain-containing protein [Candidatus Hydrogenedentota bacterium]